MYFADFGCITAIGAGTEMTMAAIAAEISGCAESDHRCAKGEPAMIASIDDGLFVDISMETDYSEPVSEQTIRRMAMTALALDDLSGRFPVEKPCPLIWVNSEQNPYDEPLPREVLRELLSDSEIPVSESIYHLNMGRAGGIYALHYANELFQQQGHDYVLIGAAQSPWNSDWLGWLDSRGRLKHIDSKDAFAPGEGAGFLLLARTPELAQAHPYQGINKSNRDKKPAVAIAAPGFAESPSHWYNDTAHKGEALLQAIDTALTNLAQTEVGRQPIKALITSQNGELFWMKEHRVAVARHAAQLKDAVHRHPFEYTGDLGTLSGLFLTAYAAHLLTRSVHSDALVYAASDDAWRAAAGLYRL